MKINIIIYSILFLMFFFVSLTNAHNPFITKPDKHHVAPEPVFKSKLFVKIIIWQNKLKEKMSYLVRQAMATHSIRPLFFLIMAAFAYGAIHAAGPGHGKAIALSYVLSQRPSYFHGMLFSNFMALSHGVSGIIFVLIIRIILNTTVLDNLESVTHITQIISYSIIVCLGLGICINRIYMLIKNKYGSGNRQKRPCVNPVLSALVVGSIPCPGVVMVMVFALSMDLIVLGMMLGLMITLGMALTISIVVIIAISGKVISFHMLTKKNEGENLLEHCVEIFAGLSLLILGTLFLVANL